jgi:hypothetical protein
MISYRGCSYLTTDLHSINFKKFLKKCTKNFYKYVLFQKLSDILDIKNILQIKIEKE